MSLCLASSNQAAPPNSMAIAQQQRKCPPFVLTSVGSSFSLEKPSNASMNRTVHLDACSLSVGCSFCREEPSSLHTILSYSQPHHPVVRLFPKPSPPSFFVCNSLLWLLLVFSALPPIQPRVAHCLATDLRGAAFLCRPLFFRYCSSILLSGPCRQSPTEARVVLTTRLWYGSSHSVCFVIVHIQ